MAGKHYDFSGWASRYDLPCSDGRTIRKGAFKDMDGETVTLTWGHEHDTPMTVLGNALIEHRDEGPYIYGSFNNSPEGQHAKEAVAHGDIKYLSIYANRLKQQAGNVMHGVIREVSLVYGYNIVEELKKFNIEGKATKAIKLKITILPSNSIKVNPLLFIFPPYILL